MALSTHAAAAAEIRKELKRNKIPATVRASSYAGGSSVRVHIKADILPAAKKEIEEFAFRYQYGHFDGMHDIYEYSNRDEGIPQVKFVFVEVDYSDELKAEISDYVDAIGGLPEHERNRYKQLVISGAWGDFWTSRKPRLAA